jgi:Sulfotransferase family
LKPNFFIVGAGKCGTSSLASYLASNKNFYIPEKKELHYFSYDFYTKNVKGPGDIRNIDLGCQYENEYLSHYKSAKNIKYVGDASPSYFSYAGVARRIKEFAPNAKIIILLRDPVERAYSNYLHLVRDGLESESFENALLLESKRLGDGWNEFWGYSTFSKYAERLKEYFEVFGRERVKVVLFEDFINDTKGQMQEIANFITNGEVFWEGETGYVVNSSGIPKLSLLSRYVYQDNLLKSIIKKMMPAKNRRIIRSLLDRIFLQKNQISLVARDIIIQRIFEDAREVQGLLSVGNNEK